MCRQPAWIHALRSFAAVRPRAPVGAKAFRRRSRRRTFYLCLEGDAPLGKHDDRLYLDPPKVKWTLRSTVRTPLEIPRTAVAQNKRPRPISEAAHHRIGSHGQCAGDLLHLQILLGRHRPKPVQAEREQRVSGGRGSRLSLHGPPPLGKRSPPGVSGQVAWRGGAKPLGLSP